jgi:hypothetical protein
MGRLADIKKMVSDGRVGFAMDEVMTGTHEFEPKFGSPGKRPMEFRVTWGPKHVAPWANPSSEQFMINDMEGTVTVDGLCYFAPCTGTLELRYFKDRTIRYAFEFKVEEENYRYVGEKVHIYPWNLFWSHTTCFGRITKVETGELVSTSVTHFRFRTSLNFMASMRLA